MKRLVLSSIASLFLLPLSLGLSSPASGATSVPGTAGGSAYAAQVLFPSGSGRANVGPLFPVTSGCSVASGTHTSSGASAHIGTLVQSGAVTDTVTNSRTASSDTMHASATVQTLSILGMISAASVTAGATSTATATTLSSAGSTTFDALTINGKALSVSPGPNTVIALPGVGEVVLNEQYGRVATSTTTAIGVIAIDVHVTLQNAFNLPIGTRIIIASTRSSFTRTSYPAVVGAGAYALYIAGTGGSGTGHSGPWASVTISCTGGRGATDLTGATVPNVASIGAMADSAAGQLTATGATATAGSSLQTVRLLNGLITASAVNATAHAGFNGKGTTSASTTFGSLSIAGIPFVAAPGPNTTVSLPGIGTVVLNEQSRTVGATKADQVVTAVDVYVTTKNALGLPVGMRIVVGHAEASATGY